jgi:hypothetical protein
MSSRMAILAFSSFLPRVGEIIEEPNSDQSTSEGASKTEMLQRKECPITKSPVKYLSTPWVVAVPVVWPFFFSLFHLDPVMICF